MNSERPKAEREAEARALIVKTKANVFGRPPILRGWEGRLVRALEDAFTLIDHLRADLAESRERIGVLEGALKVFATPLNWVCGQCRKHDPLNCFCARYRGPMDSSEDTLRVLNRGLRLPPHSPGRPSRR